MSEVTLSKKQLDYMVEQLAIKLSGLSSGLMTTEQKAKQLGIKPDTLRKKAREGRIDVEKSGESNQSRLMFRIEATIR